MVCIYDVFVFGVYYFLVGVAVLKSIVLCGSALGLPRKMSNRRGIPGTFIVYDSLE